MILARDRFRMLLDNQVTGDATDLVTGDLPRGIRGTDMQFELGFAFMGELITPSNFVSIEMIVKAAEDRDNPTPLMQKSIGLADINQTLTMEQWEAGTHQHCIIPFTRAETFLSLGNATEKRFYMSVVGITNDSPAREIPLGETHFFLESNGRSGLEMTAPLGSSIIPVGTLYDGAGNRTQTVTANNYYQWTKGANDTSLVNGTETLTTSGTFVAQGSSVTLTGTPSALITALLRWPMVPTTDQMEARLAGMLKIINSPGVLIGTVSLVNTDVSSPNFGKQFMRLHGISPEGIPVDEIIDLTAI